MLNECLLTVYLISFSFLPLEPHVYLHENDNEFHAAMKNLKFKIESRSALGISRYHEFIYGICNRKRKSQISAKLCNNLCKNLMR